MGVLDSVLGNTIGTIWRGATGTVDPWTKAGMIEDQAKAQIQAGGNPDLANQQAQSDVTSALKADKADPSDAQNGLGASLNSAKNYIIVGVVIVVGVYLYGQYLGGKRAE